MKLRFQVDQAECFRNGIDCPKSIVTIEIEPSKLTEKHRALISDRLVGIDVTVFCVQGERNKIPGHQNLKHITAKAPTFDALLDAVIQNENAILDEMGMERVKTEQDVTEFTGRMAKLDAGMVEAQDMLKAILESGESVDDVSKKLFGTPLDGFQIETFLAASTMQERLAFALKLVG